MEDINSLSVALTTGGSKRSWWLSLTTINLNRYYLFVVLIAGIVVGCDHGYTPKPKGYFRIDLPSKTYHQLITDLPFSFEVPDYARLTAYAGSNPLADPSNWTNLEIPKLNCKVHLTYKDVGTDLSELINDAHNYVSKHTVMADAIIQTRYDNPTEHVHAVLFDIKGNTASSLQFYATDSIHHFLRGALYFNNEPNKDSLFPVIEFLREDIVKMIETLHWK